MQDIQSKNEILLVTFPVDLGNRTYEKNLHKIFKDDMDTFRFAAQHVDELDNGINYQRSIKDRLRSILGLRRRLKKATALNQKVLFHGLSPAFLSFGSWRARDTTILLDWTRCLYPAVRGEKIKKNLLFYAHRAVLKRCPRIMCMTQAVYDNLEYYYGIPKAQLFKVPAPFDVEILDIPPRPTPQKPKVLFVGGDLKRKGGDILIRKWETDLSGLCELSMLTNDAAANIGGVNYLPGIRYGTEKHRKVFEGHDILILPTKMDSYPQAIGEAAAAGLAVITTKFALGATEVILERVSGYITDSADSCVGRLEELLRSNVSVDGLKLQSYSHMHKNFSNESIRKSYLKVILQKS